MKINIIGAGLAGVEAAYFLANRNIQVKLYEMKPIKFSAAHTSHLYGELVCSNSLRAVALKSAVGLLKEEMRQLDSLIIKAALHSQIPGGTSLIVDRIEFANYLTNKINSHPNIEVIIKEVSDINLDELTIIAAGPLVSNNLAKWLLELTNQSNLNFFDAVAPIIEFDSIDLNKCYFKDRYQEEGGTYLNCPMTKLEYDRFYEALLKAERHAPKDFEKEVFEACMPIEVIAERGYMTPLFGPLKPVGLEISDRKPYAVVQLRPDDFSKKMYNIVGFQTSLKQAAQKEVIRLIPGLEKANILRYGVIHKNTYFNSPELLTSGFQFKKHPNLFLAGQIAGVEGYVESAASGLAAAINLYSIISHEKPLSLPTNTMIGSLDRYVSTSNHHFVPMNANFGIVPPLSGKFRKKEKRLKYAERSLEALQKFKKEYEWI